jgi:hypothetical protein
MLPKGNQRGGGQQLATHLLNAFDNERIEIADIRHAAAQDLHGAFAEWRGQSRATNCQKYLYSLSVNPDHREREFSRQDYIDFIDRAEKKLGLADQPRAIVFHQKNGREHCHVVWSRIDTDKMRSINIHRDRDKLNAVAREYARDHEITLPEGMTRDRADKDTYRNRNKRENLHEKQQQERTGVAKAERMKAITAIWRQSDTAGAFVKGLADAGYYLASGTRGGEKKTPCYVVVDLFGEVHPLARQIEDVNTHQLKARIAGDFPLEKLPPADKARAFAKSQRDERLKDKFNVARVPTLAQRQERLKEIQAKRRTALNAQRDEMVFHHHAERAALRQLQIAETRGVSDARARPAKGLLAFLTRITGIKILQQRRQDKERSDRHRQQVALLTKKHDRERLEIDRQARDLKAVETRERLSLQTAMHRAEFMELARPQQRETDKQRTDTGRDTSSLLEGLRLAAEQKEARKQRSKDRGRDRDDDPGRTR